MLTGKKIFASMKKQLTIYNRIRVLGILLGIIGMTGCYNKQTKGATDTSTVNAQQEPVKRLTELRYYPCGKPAIMSRYHPDGTLQNRYAFTYEKDRLTLVDFGGRWEYAYSGDLLTGIRTYNEKGQLKYLYAFLYEGNLLKEKTESFVSETGVTHPLLKSLYVYGKDSNVLKKEVLLFVRGEWVKNKTELYSGYENNVAVEDDVEAVPYIPAGCHPPKLPRYVNVLDKEGKPVASRTYHYGFNCDGRMVSRETVFHASNRNPGYSEQIALQYGKDIQK